MSDETAGILTEEILSYIGREGPEETATVHLPEMLRYAQAVTLTPTANPIFTDEKAAAETPFGTPIAPFQFYSVPFTTMASPSSLKEDGIPASGGLFSVELPPIPLPRTMAGGLDVRYHRPIRDGDVLTRRTRIAGITERKGRTGPLVFTTMETTYRGADGQPVVVVRQTIISR
jgi:3-methylfumaryl-CoA hydratase